MKINRFNRLGLCTLWLCLGIISQAQILLNIEGNGRFTSPASTNVDIVNTDDNTNAIIRFGDNGLLKTTLGWNGNIDQFEISMDNILGRKDFTIDTNGLIGINQEASTHRLSILHNSTSGVAGSAHLNLIENSTSDFARLRFENNNENGHWTIASRATDGDALMNFFYNDGSEFANILSIDGDLGRVGIRKTEPEAYLHVKQVDGSTPALLLENDDQTGGEKWSFLVAGVNDDLNLYFEGDLRGIFSSATGAYIPVPPPPVPQNEESNTQFTLSANKLLNLNHFLNENMSYQDWLNQLAQLDSGWVIESGDQVLGIDPMHFTPVLAQAIRNQQDQLENQEQKIADWQRKLETLSTRLDQVEKNSRTHSKSK